MSLLESGDRVTETLVVDRLLGEGAFAEVHRVRHEYLGWQAMKVFKRVASLDETRTLLEEARLLSTLGHPNIVRVFDAGTVRTPQGVRGFFTMEYVAGGSLERLIRAHGPTIPVELAVEVAEQIASGLTAAHEQDPPILHRDLTLANILVGYEGSGLRIRISDFGLAKRADPFTMLASAQGTFAFMAPEVLRREGYSRASDVWSVGTIVYLLLTNRLPYDDGAPLSSYSPGRFARVPLPPSRYHPEVDPELDRILLSALEVDPADRPATAGVLAAELRGRRLGGGSSRSEGEPADARARRLAEQALALARHAGQLDRAAGLMAQALELSPDLRARYLPKLNLWRRGVTM
ncbi:serine/threonine protein kinase [Plantactinospora sp. BC1]|uniref:serine/threonine-protein kinase n=1 Tax=Plantactinospora sp. BC1 TaxID=2108470 RepID=UPI000D166A79|nr:serine/threonine-protein kinase [Plantactinospora sp. BC1]AVT32916.1 serine/threonine protein kinase [Plantactinospora sp. BC1]